MGGSAPAPPVDPGVVVQQLATALSLLAANQQDGAFRDDLLKVEKATEILAFADYESGTKARSIRLYSILATYLRNRPLRLLRSVADGDGFRVWRSLVDELQPSSRPRALALAQALVKFPPYKEGGSLLDYTLAFERLLTEYAKVAPHPYDDNLKISTLLAGLPSDVRKYLELNMDDSMTYEKLRTRLLQYERTTAGWSSEHVLRSVGIDKDSKFLDTSDVVPMEVDRVEKGKGKKGFGKKGTGKKGDNNYYQKGKVVHEQPNDINLVIFETPQTPTCEFFDLACEDDDWDDYFDEPDEYQVRAVELCAGSALEVEAEAEAELQSSSTLVFDIAESDEDSDCEHDVRMVSEQPMQHEFEQVILDSGADVTVLPLSHGAVGEPNANNTMIRDAQGNVIPMASYRKNVVFEVEGNEGQRLVFRDKVVVAQVKQPLLSVGKLIRDHWSLGDVDGRLQMSKGGNSFPVHMSRNSLAANMKIYRLEEHVRAVVIELSELMESGTEIQGWSLSPDGGPMHVSTSSSCTVDPSLVFPSQQWPFRTTLLSQGDRRYEVFESGEYWEDRKTLSTERPATKVVTILSAAPVEPRDIGKVIVNEQFRPEYIVPEEAPAHDDGDAWMAAAPERVPDSPPAQVDGQRGGGAEEQGDPVGPEVHLAAGRQATLVVNDVELTEDSSLKVLRRACQFLRVSKNGSKAVLWSRLQSEVADSQLRHSVQCKQLMQCWKHTAENLKRNLEQLLRMPRRWHFMKSPTAPECRGAMHVWLRGSPEHPMAVHVVMVDEHTNFVQCVPVESKSAEHVRVAVDEAVKMASLLGHTNLTLRGDSEPAMKAFMAAIVQARTRLGLATKVTYAAPDSSLHQGLKAERFIGIVRGLAKTLLRTIEEREALRFWFLGVLHTLLLKEAVCTMPERCEKVIPETDMDLSFEDMEWAHRRYEDGPPELSEEYLCRLDAAMDALEVKRLLALGVVRKLGDNQQGGNAPEGMKKLQSRFVRDWRFRGNCWIRRSRLVAKEFKFLEPELEHLYAPASMAVLQRWYLHLKEIVKGNRLKPFEGAPAVFYEKGKLACNSHVDDLQLCGGDARAQELLGSLKKGGLKVKVEGPVRIDGGECRFLKRLFVGDGSGILVVPEEKYVTKLCEILKLERAAPKPTPLPSSLKRPVRDPELEGDDYSTYRSGLGLLLYTCSDYPEIHFAVRMLGSRCSSPTEYDLMLMRHVGKYLKGRENYVLKLSRTSPGTTFEERVRKMDSLEDEDWRVSSAEPSFKQGHLIEIVTDADWASSHFSRKSVSCYSMYLNGNCVYVSTKLQQTLALSSCEAEYMASLAGCADALFVKALLEEVTDSEVTIIHRTDNSGARAIISKQGCGRLRHIDLAYLWLQREYQLGRVIEKVITTEACPPDIGTKAHPRRRQQFLLGLLGFVNKDTKELAGSDDVNAYLIQSGLKSGLKSRSGKAAVRLIMAMLLTDPADAANIKDDNAAEFSDHFLTSFVMVMIGFFIVGIFTYIVFYFNKLCVNKENKCFRILVLLALFLFQADAVKYTITIEIDGEGRVQREGDEQLHGFTLVESASSQPIVAPGGGATSSTSSATGGATSSSSSTAASSATTGPTTTSGAPATRATTEDGPPVGYASGVVTVWRIGHGSCYHRQFCGMVNRARRVEPHKLLELSRRQAEAAGLKPADSVVLSRTRSFVQQVCVVKTHVFSRSRFWTFA
ncbi:GIP [Symbiodinium sp. CCMP2592]|nr:GIP [Symbiodinium sp. CCMP2592]